MKNAPIKSREKTEKPRVLCETGNIADLWLCDEVKKVDIVTWFCGKLNIAGIERAENFCYRSSGERSTWLSH